MKLRKFVEKIEALAYGNAEIWEFQVVMADGIQVVSPKVARTQNDGEIVITDQN